MNEEREKVIRNCFKIFAVLDRFDQLDDSDYDCIDHSFINCKRNRVESREECVVEVGASLVEKNECEETLRKSSNPTKGLLDVQNPLEVLSQEQFIRTYRFTKECVLDILEMISYGLTKFTNRGKPFSPILQVLITLQFLTTGRYIHECCRIHLK